MVGITLIFHLPLAYFASVEILDNPLWSKQRKLSWLFFTWLVPFIGFAAAHKKLGLKVKGGGTGGEDTYTPGGD